MSAISFPTGADHMAPPSGNKSWFEEQMVEQMKEVAARLKGLETQSELNGRNIDLLRTELIGSDGMYGRVPRLEREVAALKQQVADVLVENSQLKVKRQLWADWRTLVTSSLAAAIITALWHWASGH